MLSVYLFEAIVDPNDKAWALYWSLGMHKGWRAVAYEEALTLEDQKMEVIFSDIQIKNSSNPERIEKKILQKRT